MSALVIVESPAKAKTINKYLGKDFKVLASFGHIRDLPSKNGSVRPEEQFAMDWEMDSRGKKHMKEITDAAKTVDEIFLATDPDREGEAISWHVNEVLKSRRALGTAKARKPVRRIVFNEITKKAVQHAVANPRDLDTPLIDAYMARRALDYLVGFNLSPVLWRKLPGSKSAGRVQSVALRLICEREGEIEAFVPKEYWQIEAACRNQAKDAFTASLKLLDGDKVEKFTLNTEALATAAVKKAESETYTVAAISKKRVQRKPAPPFITSTMQQEAARKLYFAASQTMRVAQGLYEGVKIGGETVGLITYMRTDGTQLADEAVQGCREFITKNYGDKYLPGSPNIYKSKAKNAQEAHEAIRPTDVRRTPESVAQYLKDDQLKLYTLIWRRTMACQMTNAQFDQTGADIANQNKKIVFRATGSVLVFDGFLKVYREDKDDAGADDDKDKRLPALQEGEAIDIEKITPSQHFTAPPPRFTEASLVKRMEELGIGRPSTYASILQVLKDRGYVRLEEKRFTPEERGRVVTTFLEKYFQRYVEYDFTASLEEELDKISAGDLDWKAVMQRFWDSFKNAVDNTADLRISEVIDILEVELATILYPPREDGKDAKLCPACNKGEVHLRLSKYGSFMGCNRYPECSYTRHFGKASENDEIDPRAAEAAAAPANKELGQHPNGDMIFLKKGPYGYYVQLGEGKKPKRASLGKTLKPDEVTLEQAVEMLKLPRLVGKDPDTGDDILANKGRYGPYVQHGKIFASLKEDDDVMTVTLDRALELIEEKKNAPKGRRFQKK